MNPVLVTGSTDGIGYAAATLLAAAGRSVIVHGKDPARGRPSSRISGPGTRPPRSI